MKNMMPGEVWFVEFPLEEDPTTFINRPVVVLDVDKLEVLSVKVTKHAVRKEDPYDMPIMYWKEAKLKFASTARISKVTKLPGDSFIFKIGDLHEQDMNTLTDVYIKYINNILSADSKRNASSKVI